MDKFHRKTDDSLSDELKMTSNYSLCNPLIELEVSLNLENILIVLTRIIIILFDLYNNTLSQIMADLDHLSHIIWPISYEPYDLAFHIGFYETSRFEYVQQ